MYYRFEKSSDQQDQNDMGGAVTPTDDQRSRPREGTIEKIADIAYDALRKHQGPWQSDESDDNIAEDLAS